MEEARTNNSYTVGGLNTLSCTVPAENRESNNAEITLIESVYDILDRRFKQLVKVVLDSVESNEGNAKIKQKIWDIKDLLANDFLSTFSRRIRRRLDTEE